MWRMVVIDDEEKVLRGMKKIIPWKELNCEWVGEAKNGQAGLELIRETAPDIVITDIYMPVMNGIEMIQSLRDEGFDGKVIILSGYSEFEHARQAMRLKIDDYLNKPASIQTIKEVLNNLVDQLKQENKKQLKYEELTEKIKVYEPFVEKEWIKSVVTGTVNPANFPESVKSVTEEWGGKEHAVLAITYDQTLENSPFYQEDWHLFRFATSNIIKETTNNLFEDFQYIELHSHQAALCIHTYSELHHELMKQLEQLSKEIELNIKNSLSVNVSVSLGGIKEQWNELADSLREAIYALSNSPSYKAEHITTLEHNPELSLVTTNQKTLWSESMEANQKLSETIRYCDERAAFQVMDEFFNSIKEQPFNQAAAVRIGIEMWTIMTYSLHDIGIRIHDMFAEDFDLYKELTKLHSWDNLADNLKEKVTQICQHQQWEENLKHKQLVEQMTEYVQNHIGENITLQDLAEELYISRNYLGQIFKTIVGESFKNYLTRMRMEKAKKMIQEGNYLIYEISEKVGYVNPAYFTTTFKKYTGYTPTELTNKKLFTDSEQIH